MHVIRLRGPWQAILLAADADSAPASVFERRFGKPTGLDAGERVELVIDPAPAEVRLNDRALTSLDESSFRAAVASLLLPRNTLVVRAPAGLSPGAPLPFEVRLEIMDG